MHQPDRLFVVRLVGVASRARVLLVAVLVVGSALLAGCARDAEPKPTAEDVAAQRLAAGRETFLSYCASCHGRAAMGDGPVADSLAVRPADLTRIALRSPGGFDAAEVARYVDGRVRVAAHGPSDMPVWGRRFGTLTDDGFRDETLLSPGSILTLVEYLESIQLQQ